MRFLSAFSRRALPALLAVMASCAAAQDSGNKPRFLPGDSEGKTKATIGSRLSPLATEILLKTPKTTLETGFLNEVNDEGFRHWVLHSPGNQPFRWSTEWDQADEGYWRLLGPGLRGRDVVLATGVASGTGKFGIDLRKYLPGEPPEDPVIYKVDIVARIGGKLTDVAGTSTGDAKVKAPAKELGVASVPVLLTYVADDASPTEFEIPTVYRKADLVLETIAADDLQFEVGTEEYRVAGFVQELFRPCHDEASLDCKYTIPGFHQQFGPFGKNLSPSRKTVGFGVPYQHPDKGWITEKRRWTFPLTSQSGYPLARGLVVTGSVLEVDSGGELDDWTLAISEFEDAIYIEKIMDFSKSELEEFLQENAGEALRLVADGVVSFVEGAAGQAASAIPVVGWAVLAGGFVVENVINSIPDDYCGTRSHMLTLPSLSLTDVHKLPGKVVGTGAERRYVTESFHVPYACPPHPNSATNKPDGYGKIFFRWEFYDPYTP